MNPLEARETGQDISTRNQRMKRLYEKYKLEGVTLAELTALLRDKPDFKFKTDKTGALELIQIQYPHLDQETIYYYVTH